MRGTGTGKGGTEGTILSWSPRKNQRKLRCDVKVNWIKLEGGTAVLCPVAGKILRARIGASAIHPLECFPFGRAAHAQRRLKSACHGAMIGRKNQMQRGTVVGKNGHAKASP